MKKITKNQTKFGQVLMAFACTSCSASCPTCQGCTSGDTAASLMNSAQGKNASNISYVSVKNLSQNN